MDEQQQRIRDDLRGVVRGEVFVEDLHRAAFATDASILEIRPLAVVAPKTIEEAISVVRYARDQGLKVHPRGAGTGLAGESLGPGLMIDTSRHLNEISPLQDQTIRVQAGVRGGDLARVLSPAGRMFPPDPVSGQRCTIAGMIGSNAAGPHSLRYGSTRDYIVAVKGVLADGTVVDLRREPVLQTPTKERTSQLAHQLAGILEQHAGDIDREQPASLLKTGGYQLRGLLDDGSVDLARLMAGSEGTLALLLEAELATLPTPKHRGILLACFRSLEAAAHAVIESLEYLPAACEMLDRRLLAMIRELTPAYAQWIPDDAEALLLLEQQGDHPVQVRERIVLMANRLGRVTKLATESLQIFREPELSMCWEVRHRASPRLAISAGSLQPIAVVENSAVPPERLPEMIRRAQDIMKRHGVTACYSAHAGVGILHARPLLDLRRSDHRRLLSPLSDEMHEAALELGGASNGEHAVGLLRSGQMARQYPKLERAFRAIKSTFDPSFLFNPGRIVGGLSEFPAHLLRARPVATDPALSAEPRSSLLLWNELPLLESADRCNGCGSCQQATPAMRMCPSYKATPDELASPRSKANLLRQTLRGELDPKLLSKEEFRKLADTCVNCKMCKLECPSAVDISKLMLEAKAAHVAEQGLGSVDWFFANIESWSRWGSANALFANALLRGRLSRWMIEKFVGLSRERRLPRFHHRSFMRRASRHGWTRKPRLSEPRPKVALFVDVFPNFHDPQLGECAARVLEFHHRRVYAPPQQVGSGMAFLSHGDIDSARAALDHNLALFAELARDGHDIVTLEPSAALMFRDEARHLVSDPDLALVAARTYEFSEYMALLGQRGDLRGELASLPVSVGYHEPCHQRALGPRADLVSLMSRIPGLQLTTLNLGCSGMAGTFGLRRDSFALSRDAGRAVTERLSASDLHFGVTQCSACRMQLEQFSGKRTLHPAKWLALAYGLVKRPHKMLASPAPSLCYR